MFRYSNQKETRRNLFFICDHLERVWELLPSFFIYHCYGVATGGWGLLWRCSWSSFSMIINAGKYNHIQLVGWYQENQFQFHSLKTFYAYAMFNSTEIDDDRVNCKIKRSSLVDIFENIGWKIILNNSVIRK